MAKEGSIYRKGDYEYQVRGGKAQNFNIQRPEKKAAPAKPKPKADMKPKAVKPKPMPEYKGGEQRFRPAPDDSKKTDRAPVRRPTRPGQDDSGPGFNIGPFRLDKGYSPEHPGKPIWGVGFKGFKNGGGIRGDGEARVKTKGRCL